MNEYIQHVGSSTDIKLKILLARGIGYLGEEGLQGVVLAHQRFNEPVTVEDEHGRRCKDENWSLKQVLTYIPRYVKAAKKAGVQPIKAQELLVHTINSNPYEFTQVERDVIHLGNAMEELSEQGRQVSPKEFEQLKAMITLGGKEGVIDSALYAYRWAIKVGLSSTQAVRLISKLPEADGSLSGYTFSSFNDALKTLSIAETDSKLVVKVFNLIGGKRPYYRQSVYQRFEVAVTFGCPSHDMKPNELLQAIVVAQKAGTSIEDFLDSFVEGDAPALPVQQRVEVINTLESRDRYFVSKKGKLEHAALPYRTVRNFEDGMGDLADLAHASYFKGDWVGEGFWVFDQASDTWYSFGGQLEPTGRGVRHNMLPYDLAVLSKHPILVHVHPEELETFVYFRAEDAGLPREVGRYDNQITDFIAATPSRADFTTVAQLLEQSSALVPTRSLIVNKLGVTEFIYPNDVNAIKDMGTRFRDVRDRTILNHDWQNTFDQRTIFGSLIKQLNKELPPDFSIKFYPNGSIVTT